MREKDLKSKIVILLSLLLIICRCDLSDSVRDKVVHKELFDYNWLFKKGDIKEARNLDYDDSSWEIINLPHDFSIREPFSKKWASCTGYLPGGIAWYRKHFTLPEKFRDKKVFILFDGIYKNSSVWLNGKKIGFRPYGYISFYYDITPYLNFGENENVIAVRVDHSDYADSRWYTGSGIYRHVWLIVKEKIYIPIWGTFITTPYVTRDIAKINVETVVKNETEKSSKCTVINTVIDTSGRVKSEVRSSYNIPPKSEHKFVQAMNVDHPELWSPDKPYLYTLETKVLNGGKIVDKEVSKIGIRHFYFSADSGFFLNGDNIKIKGVCLHHDLGPLGAALNEKVLEKKIKLLKEAGCNAIRTSHNPPSPELLDLCDKYGMLVMCEAFDEWARGKKKWIKGRNVGFEKGDAGKGVYFSLDGYNKYFEEWGVKDIKDMILRDRNHPSIILWSIGNEIDYHNDPYSFEKGKPSPYELVTIAKKLVSAVKEIDTTRPVTAALANIPMSNKIGLPEVLDVVGYNYQEKYYSEDHKKYPDRIIIGSENGHSYEAWLAVKNNVYISSQFLWTGADYLGEAWIFPFRSFPSGLLDLCLHRKPRFYFRKCLWTDDPTLFLVTKRHKRPDRTVLDLGKLDSLSNEDVVKIMERFSRSSHWNYEEGEDIAITCYTNCDEVELFLNNKSQGVKYRVEGSKPELTWIIPYKKGILKAIGKKNGEVVCSYELKTAGKPAQLLVFSDKSKIKADYRDVAFIEVRIADENGVLVPNADNRVYFRVKGPGKLIAVCNGNPASTQSFVSDNIGAYNGKCVGIIQSTFNPGKIQIVVSSRGLVSDTLSIVSY